jgi:predicted ATPase
MLTIVGRTPLLKSIQLSNFLSFGPKSPSIPMRALNVFIGPNGSGKSNVLEAISLIAAAPGELPTPIREGGGVREWLWKGEGAQDRARVEVILNSGTLHDGKRTHDAIRYRLEFRENGSRFEISDERVEYEDPDKGNARPFFFFGYQHGKPMLSVRGQQSKRELKREDIDPTLSILAQRKDPDAYPELTEIGRLFGASLLYRHWFFGPESPVRLSCPSDVRTDRLGVKLENLAARLAVLKKPQKLKKQILEALRQGSEAFTDIEVVPEGGQLRLFLVESDRETPATRLSDGTLRLLCLLTILLDPAPPALIGIEEPELGLHPDLMPLLARLLKEASKATQLFVTTHSDALVSALSDTPESIVVCEKRDGRSHLQRLTSKEVEPFLKDYRLGQLWMRGDLGGTRW